MISQLKKNRTERTLRGMSFRYKIFILVCALVVLLRVFLPFGIRHSINQRLKNDLPNYSGSIESFGLSFYKGSYHIEGLRIWKKDRADYDALLSVDKLEVSLLTHLLLEQKILGSLEVTRAKVNLIDSILRGNQQLGDGSDWRHFLNTLIPFNLESVKVNDSSLLFTNKDYKRPVQVSLDKVYISAINIHNTERVLRKLPSQMNFSARIQRDGWLRGNLQFDFQGPLPSLNAKVNVTSLNLAKLNNTFILYGPYYFLNGEMNMYSQVFMTDGNLRGYLTPFFKNVDAVSVNWNNRFSRSYLSDGVQALGDLVLKKSMKKAQGRRYAFSGQMSVEQEPWCSFWSTVRSGFNKPPAKRPLANKKKKNIIADKEKEPLVLR